MFEADYKFGLLCSTHELRMHSEIFWGIPEDSVACLIVFSGRQSCRKQWENTVGEGNIYVCGRQVIKMTSEGCWTLERGRCIGFWQSQQQSIYLPYCGTAIYRSENWEHWYNSPLFVLLNPRWPSPLNAINKCNWREGEILKMYKLSSKWTPLKGSLSTYRYSSALHSYRKCCVGVF